LQKIRNTPLIGRELRVMYEKSRTYQRRIGELSAGLFDALGIRSNHHRTRGQQWDAIRRNSRDVLHALDAPSDPPVLFMTVWGGNNSPILSTIESVLAVAVRLRGVRAVAIMCDKTLPACSYDARGNRALPVPREFEIGGEISAVRCAQCTYSIRDQYAPSPVELDSFKTFFQPGDLERITRLVDALNPKAYREYRYKDVHVGDHAHASVLRELGRGTLLDDPYHEWLFRRFLISSMLTVDLTERVIAAYQPARIVAPHGIYVEHGTISEVARRQGIPVAVFSFSYRKDTVMICHGDTYHRALVTEPVELWENIELSSGQEQRLVSYLDAKRHGKQDSITYHSNPIEDRAALYDSLKLDRQRPVISMFTNVMWDAQVYHTYNAFDSQLDWIFQTIQYFERQPELQLVIRVHPAEVKAFKKSQQRVADEVTHALGTLPDNVKIISPDSDLSSYTLVDISQAALIYGTKMGLEIALRGVPVIIAGESMHRGKGISYDVTTAQEYFELLDRITELPRNPPDMMARAKKYGYHFFFRRQIDFPFVTGFQRSAKSDLTLAFDNLGALLPGQNAALDMLCDGIIRGTEFVGD